MAWNPPALTQTRITLTEPVVIANPAEFIARWLADDAIAVVERHADVQILPLRDVAFDDRAVFVHAFSATARTDVRAARTPHGWLVDAVREDANDGRGRPALGRPGRHLCLGKAVPGEKPGTTMLEARIRPYSLPVEIAADSNVCVEFIDYYAEEDDTGDLHCFAHRVVAIRSLEHG